MTLFLHVGNVLYLAAYSVRDMLWLRIITVVAILCMVPYYFFQPTPLYAAIAWNGLFSMVNLFQIVMLILEKRPVFLGDEELHLYRTVFRALKPREFAKLLTIAEWKQAKPGEELLQQDQPVSALMLISSGHGAVEVDGRRIAQVTSGQFVGEMGFLTDQHASARVVAASPVAFLAWPAAKLRGLLAATPALHVKMQGVLGSDLVAKLRYEAITAAHPSRVITALRGAGLS